MQNSANSWDVEKVRDTFNPLIAAKILKIQLSTLLRPNKWVWEAEKQGKFSMKSAYQLLQTRNRST